MRRHLLGPALLLCSLACAGSDDEAVDTGPPGAGLPVDEDGDGFDSEEDCRDQDPLVNPEAAEVCDGVDNDCDGEVDEGLLVTVYTDADGDGYGDSSSEQLTCQPAEGEVLEDGDCDDADAEVGPEAVEICNGLDDDCDGAVDADDPTLNLATRITSYADGDGDGYGDPDAVTESCEAPSGNVERGGDCDDSDASVNPEGAETCDGVDQDCSGVVDDGLLGSGKLCAAESCLAVLEDQPASIDADYWVGDPAARLLCDMTWDGGGWTKAVHWNRQDEGDSLADFQSDFMEEANTMGSFTEEADHLSWCDGDGSGDTASFEIDVTVPNSGEVRWSIGYELDLAWSNSGTWLYADVASGDEANIVCAISMDDPAVYDSSVWSTHPDYSCSNLEDLPSWDYTDETRNMGDEVETFWLTSLHSDSSCDAVSRLYRLEAWVR